MNERDEIRHINTLISIISPLFSFLIAHISSLFSSSPTTISLSPLFSSNIPYKFSLFTIALSSSAITSFLALIARISLSGASTSPWLTSQAPSHFWSSSLMTSPHRHHAFQSYSSRIPLFNMFSCELCLIHSLFHHNRVTVEILRKK